MKTRPTALVVEPDSSEAISARKLVLETGKFNVITAHSIAEGMISLKQHHPEVLVLHAGVRENDPNELVRVARQSEEVFIIGLKVPGHDAINGTDRELDSNAPQELLELLVETFGDPKNEISTVKPEDPEDANREQQAS